MTLTIKDRLILPNVVPQKNSFIKLILAEEIKNKIIITGEEIKEYSIKDVEGGGVTWDDSKKQEKEFDITDSEKELVAEQLREMDKNKELTIEHIELYKKFNK